MSIVFDTSVLIDVLRNEPAAVDFVRGVDDVPACSELTRIEIARGLRGAERTSAERLFQTMRWIPVDERSHAEPESWDGAGTGTGPGSAAPISSSRRRRQSSTPSSRRRT